jgi:uncharacterized Zn finger protein (UPF0148 family)
MWEGDSPAGAGGDEASLLHKGASMLAKMCMAAKTPALLQLSDSKH